MPLGLAKDSMINLAELATKKDEEENQSSALKIELDDGGDGENDDGKSEKVMRLSTREIRNPTVSEREGLGPASSSSEKDEDSSITGGANPTDLSTEASETSTVIVEDSAGESDRVSSPTPNKVTAPISSADSSDSGMVSDSTAGKPSPTPGQQSPSSSYGQYSGFAPDYHDYANYGDPVAYTSYRASGNLVLGGKQESQSFWCCLFPWFAKAQDGVEGSVTSDLGEPGNESLVKVDGSRAAPPVRSASKDDDEVSTGSDMFGEKLSDKDRQAVLARLRLAQPDAASPSGGENPDDIAGKKGLLNAIVSQGESSELKGILRRPSKMSRMDKLNSQSPNGESGARRRSLFPSYETSSKGKKNLKCEFSPMARVLSVKSHKEMLEFEKGEIWWRRSDYEGFRKTGRMITKAMLEGGSEIWLATNRSWQAPNKDRTATLKLAERHAAFKKGDINAKREYEDTRDKWWHKFGHSRRGLEHIASIDEGRQRQGNVRAAIRAVLDEQRRQKVYSREDPEKLRMVSIQHTSWARDLAMAAGASDADAVSKNFNDDSRKSREFYLLKFSRSSQASVSKTERKHTPAFMKPAIAMTTVKPNRLDVNTMSQIRFRKSQKKKAAVAPAPPPKASTPINGSATSIPLKDDDAMSSHSMAKKAAGYASGEVMGNMASVLSGMGALPKEAAAVGGP